MAGILESIERSNRAAEKTARDEIILPFSYKPALVAFFGTPFMLAKVIFVPVFGQLVLILNFFLLLLYFRERRNWYVTISIIGSMVASIGFLIIISSNFPRNIDLFIGTLMTLSIAVSLLLTFMISYQIVSIRLNNRELIHNV